MSQTLQELLAAKADLEAAISAKKAADAEARAAAIVVMKAKCAELGIGARDVFEPVKVSPQYTGPNGESWTGRGVVPKWLAALEATGHNRESFKIKAD